MNKYYDVKGRVDHEKLLTIVDKTVTKDARGRVIGWDVCDDELFYSVVSKALHHPSYTLENTEYLCNVVQLLHLHGEISLSTRLKVRDRITLLLNEGDLQPTCATLHNVISDRAGCRLSFDANVVWFSELLKMIKSSSSEV